MQFCGAIKYAIYTACINIRTLESEINKHGRGMKGRKVHVHLKNMCTQIGVSRFDLHHYFSPHVCNFILLYSEP
jgi:hypothetical protein